MIRDTVFYHICVVYLRIYPNCNEEFDFKSSQSINQSISIAPLQVTFYSEALPATARTLCWSFHVESHRAIVSEGLAQGPYVAPRAGFEPTTLGLQANDLTHYHHASTIDCIHQIWPWPNSFFMFIFRHLKF